MNEYEEEYNYGDEDEFYLDGEEDLDEYLDYWNQFLDEEDDDNEGISFVDNNPYPKEPTPGDSINPDEERELVPV